MSLQAWNFKRKPIPCPLCRRRMGLASLKAHMQACVKVGGKFVCSGNPEHPRHAKAEQQRSMRKGIGTRGIHFPPDGCGLKGARRTA